MTEYTDTQRLDWMIEHNARVFAFSFNDGKARIEFFKDEDDLKGAVLFGYDTPKEAIDAAMTQESE